MRLSFHIHESSLFTEIAVGLRLLWIEKTLVLQSMHHACRQRLEADWTPCDYSSGCVVKDSKLTGHQVFKLVARFKLAASSRWQWSNDPCQFEIFLSPLRLLCSLCCVLMSVSKHFLNNFWASMVHGTASVRKSVRLLLISSFCR